MGWDLPFPAIESAAKAFYRAFEDGEVDPYAPADELTPEAWALLKSGPASRGCELKEEGEPEVVGGSIDSGRALQITQTFKLGSCHPSARKHDIEHIARDATPMTADRPCSGCGKPSRRGCPCSGCLAFVCGPCLGNQPMKIVRAAGPVACHTCMHMILSNAERLIEKSTAEPVVTEGDSFSRLESVIRVELDRFCTYFEGAVDSLHHRLRAVEAKDGDGAHQPSKVSSGSPNDLARVRIEAAAPVKQDPFLFSRTSATSRLDSVSAQSRNTSSFNSASTRPPLGSGDGWGHGMTRLAFPFAPAPTTGDVERGQYQSLLVAGGIKDPSLVMVKDQTRSVQKADGSKVTVKPPPQKDMLSWDQTDFILFSSGRRTASEGRGDADEARFWGVLQDAVVGYTRDVGNWDRGGKQYLLHAFSGLLDHDFEPADIGNPAVRSMLEMAVQKKLTKDLLAKGDSTKKSAKPDGSGRLPAKAFKAFIAWKAEDDHATACPGKDCGTKYDESECFKHYRTCAKLSDLRDKHLASC